MRSFILSLGALLALAMTPAAPAAAAGFTVTKPDTSELSSAVVSVRHRGKRHHAHRVPLYYYSAAPYYYRWQPHSYPTSSYSRWRRSDPGVVQYSPRRIYHWRHRPWW